MHLKPIREPTAVIHTQRLPSCLPVFFLSLHDIPLFPLLCVCLCSCTCEEQASSQRGLGSAYSHTSESSPQDWTNQSQVISGDTALSVAGANHRDQWEETRSFSTSGECNNQQNMNHLAVNDRVVVSVKMFSVCLISCPKKAGNGISVCATKNDSSFFYDVIYDQSLQRFRPVNGATLCKQEQTNAQTFPVSLFTVSGDAGERRRSGLLRRCHPASCGD